MLPSCLAKFKNFTISIEQGYSAGSVVGNFVDAGHQLLPGHYLAVLQATDHFSQGVDKLEFPQLGNFHYLRIIACSLPLA
jgi:hypothetical protein